MTKVSAPKPPWCPRSGRRRRAPWPRPPRSAAGPLVGHVDAAPQRGVGGREAVPRAADQPGPEQDLRHVQLREHGRQRVRRHLRPVPRLVLRGRGRRSRRRRQRGRGHWVGLGFSPAPGWVSREGRGGEGIAPGVGEE